MHFLISIIKSVSYTIVGVVWLLATVYANALLFLLAVLADKAFKLLGFTVTVDSVMRDIEYYWQSRYDAYKHSLENFHLKNFKLPF